MRIFPLRRACCIRCGRVSTPAVAKRAQLTLNITRSPASPRRPDTRARSWPGTRKASGAYALRAGNQLVRAISCKAGVHFSARTSRAPKAKGVLAAARSPGPAPPRHSAVGRRGAGGRRPGHRHAGGRRLGRRRHGGRGQGASSLPAPRSRITSRVSTRDAPRAPPGRTRAPALQAE